MRALLPVACLFAVMLGCAMQSTVPPEWVRVGEGDYAYAWDAQWGTLPEGMAIGSTHGGMAVDATGRVWATTDAVNSVLQLNPEGTLGGHWGGALAGGLHGICVQTVDVDEALWMVHTAQHRIVKYTPQGEELWSVGWPEESGKYDADNQFKPTGIAVAPDGRFWVADGYGRGWIHSYAADGTWLRCFGGPGEEPGKFRTPHGIAWDDRGDEPRLLIADRENHRVQVFTPDGEYLSHIDGFRRPCGVAVSPELLAVPDLAGRVTLVDRDDRIVAHLGDNPDPAKRATNRVPVEDWRVGEFLSPHGAAWDADGALYVQDWSVHGRLTRLVPLR